MAPNGVSLDKAKVTIAETDYHDVMELTLTVKCMIDIPYLTRIMESE